MAVVVHVDHIEGEDLPLLARPEAGGSTLFRTEVAQGTAALAVYDPQSATPNTAVYSKSLATASDPDGSDDECMFSALQTDSTWGLDGGYTFAAWVRDSEQHLDGGKSYRVEVTFSSPGHSTPTWPQRADYGDLKYVWHVHVKPTASA